MLNKKTAWTDALLIALAGFLLWWALHFYIALPYTDNEGAFVLFGREMGNGARLYADIWDHKPPFYFGLSWLIQLFFPLTDIHLHLLGLLIHALNAFLLFRVSKALGFSKGGAWVSVMGYFILLFPPIFLPWEVDSDLLATPLLLFSFEAALSPKRQNVILSGVLFGAAFLTKQSVLFLLPIYVFVGVWKELPKAFRWFVGAALPVGLVSIYFAWTGRWLDFNEALLGFNVFYVESGWAFFFNNDVFRRFLVQMFEVALAAYGIPLLIFALALPGKNDRNLLERTSPFLLFWFICSLGAGFASGYFFTYYFIALFPPLALGMGLAWTKWEGNRKIALALCGTALLLGMIVLGLNGFGTRDHVFAYAQYPTQRYFEDKGLGMAIAAHAKPGDELFAWADDPQLYVYSGLKPALKTPFINHLGYMPYLAMKTYRDFIEKPPRFFLRNLSTQVLAPPLQLQALLKRNYKKVKSLDDMELYVLKPFPVLK